MFDKLLVKVETLGSAYGIMIGQHSRDISKAQNSLNFDCPSRRYFYSIPDKNDGGCNSGKETSIGKQKSAFCFWIQHGFSDLKYTIPPEILLLYSSTLNPDSKYSVSQTATHML
jgi:hypothetical protein